MNRFMDMFDLPPKGYELSAWGDHVLWELEIVPIPEYWLRSIVRDLYIAHLLFELRCMKWEKRIWA